ncbi:hypothetical protein LEMLEM_LOCUS23357 [Lemmus lemmus]
MEATVTVTAHVYRTLAHGHSVVRLCLTHVNLDACLCFLRGPRNLHDRNWRQCLKQSGVKCFRCCSPERYVTENIEFQQTHFKSK